MTTRITSTDAPAWERVFLDFMHSAFRLETLQYYSEPVEAKHFKRFLAGEDPEFDLSWWATKVRKHRAAGHQLSRVRIVVEPSTNYTRMELLAFQGFVEAGDDIRIVAVPDGGWPEGIPHEDYWLIDERDVWLMVYDEKGALRYAELQDHDDDLLAQHLRWRDIAWQQAIPLAEYLARVGPDALHPTH